MCVYIYIYIYIHCCDCFIVLLVVPVEVQTDNLVANKRTTVVTWRCPRYYHHDEDDHRHHRACTCSAIRVGEKVRGGKNRETEGERCVAFLVWGDVCLVAGIRVLLPAAVRCDMVLHQAFRARHVRKSGIGGEV